jgi:hypothetical protein
MPEGLFGRLAIWLERLAPVHPPAEATP